MYFRALCISSLCVYISSIPMNVAVQNRISCFVESSLSIGRRAEWRTCVKSVRRRYQMAPVASLRRWILQNLPFGSDNEWNEIKRSAYESAPQNRWKNAINQVGIGLTDEEKAEAARIRRARLVAQDPLYTQRLMGSSAANSKLQQQQVLCCWCAM